MNTNNNRINESSLRAIFNEAVDGMIVINEIGIIESVNPAVTKMFLYDENELLGKNISILMPEPDRSRHDQYLKHHNSTGERKIIGIGREVKGRRKDGSVFPFFLSVSEVMLEDRKVFAGVLHDITDLKKAQKAMEEYARSLEVANKELEDFAYISSHDLQEPLRKVQAFADRLQRTEYDVLSEEGKDYLNRIINASNRMQRLINDLLQLSRINTRGGNLNPIDLNVVLRDVLDDLELMIEKNEATVKVHELPVVMGDETQMHQLFQNLISNAIKFKHIDRKPMVEVYSESGEEHQPVTIMVKDNGIGIDEKYSEKVFTIFQRLHGTKYEGSGIGLAVCKKIVSRFGGRIAFKSTMNEGTTFMIQLNKK